MSYVIIHFKTNQPDTVKGVLCATTHNIHLEFQPASDSYLDSLSSFTDTNDCQWFSWNTFVSNQDDYRHIFNAVVSVKGMCELILESTSNSDQVWHFDFKWH